LSKGSYFRAWQWGKAKEVCPDPLLILHTHGCALDSEAKEILQKPFLKRVLN
jgi:hypothetical protein